MLALLAKNGRFVLVGGLFLGASLPGLAAEILPFVEHLIGALLFLNAFRTGDQIRPSIRASLGRTTAIVIGLQMALPLAALGSVTFTGIGLTPFTFAAILMMSAPALTGSPNFASMVGGEPTDAMRILVVGTLLFPLTALVMLWALPGIDGLQALMATVRLASTILLVVAAGVALRQMLGSRFNRDWLNTNCDGLSALLLAVAVVGLMADFGPLLRSSLAVTLLWVGAVMGLNLGLQFGALVLLRRIESRETIAVSIISGNRNIALFLIALPEDIMRQAMLFIGCYQIPMYLTPLIMRRALSKGLSTIQSQRQS